MLAQKVTVPAQTEQIAQIVYALKEDWNFVPLC